MNTGFVKNIVIAGFPDGGKIFFMIYIGIYACSKKINVITVAMMCLQEIQLGGWHCHTLSCISVDSGNNISVY